MADQETPVCYAWEVYVFSLHEIVEHAAKDATDEGRGDKQPELRQGPAALDHRRGDRTRRIERGVGDRDAHDMHRGQRQPDRHRGHDAGAVGAGNPGDDKDEQSRSAPLPS